MARVSLIEEQDHPELAELIGKIRAGRRGALINVYKLLLQDDACLAAIIRHGGELKRPVHARWCEIQHTRALEHPWHDPLNDDVAKTFPLRWNNERPAAFAPMHVNVVGRLV